MDVNAAFASVQPVKEWNCPCQGCKKAKKYERFLIISSLIESGYLDAAEFLASEESNSR